MSEERPYDPSLPSGVTSEELYDLYCELGSHGKVAQLLGMSRQNVSVRLKRYRSERNLDRKIPNFEPGVGRDIKKVSTSLDKDGNPTSYNVAEAPTPDPANHQSPLAVTKRVSTLTGADGNIISQWHITTPSAEEEAEAMEQIIEGLKEEVPRYAPAAFGGATPLTKLHNNYVLSDAHIGAMAWAPETGDDWDLDIAEEMLVKCMEAMIISAPRASNCTLALLGDWIHYDMLEAVTTISRNVIDADGRSPKMNKVAIRVARKIIDIALYHHETVTLLVAEGNHDLIASNWLREVLMVAYENESRVVFIDVPKPYYAFLQGNILHCWHHGHIKGLKKPEELVALFADEYRDLWGQATKVYVNTGHFHYLKELAVRGATLVQHPTLAGRNSYEARGGWGSMREAIGSTYHEKHGKKGTFNISPEMLDDM